MMQTQLTIAGVDVTSYLIGKARLKDGSNSIIRDSIVFVLKSIDDVLTLTSGQAVIFSRGLVTADEVKFRGIVGTVREKLGHYELVVYDKIWNTVNRIVTKTWDINIDSEAGVWSEIFKTIVNDYTDLTCDATTITSSSAYPTVDKFAAQEDTAYNLLNKIADILGWAWGYDHVNDKVWLSPLGGSLYGTTLEVGVNVTNNPAFVEDFTCFFNKLILLGDFQVCETTELFSGDGSETDFTLTATPYSVKVEEDVTGTWTERKGGTEDMISGIDYYVDKDNKKIVFIDNIPAAGASNVRVTYSYKSPIKITGQDDTSIATYGQIDTRITQLDLRTVADALQRHTKLLEKFSTPLIKTEVLTTQTDITTQNKVTIIDSTKGVSYELDVIEIEYTIPYSQDKLSLGFNLLGVAWFGVSTAFRVKQLQDQIMGQVDIESLSYLKTIDLDLEIDKWQAIYEAKYDTFVLNVSPLGDDIAWYTDDTWNLGTHDGTTTSAGVLTFA